MLAVALSCVAWQAHQPVPRRILSGASSEIAKVPIGYPGTAGKPGAAGMPLRVVGASTINRMRPVDMALGSDVIERVLGMPLADAIPFARSRLGVVCCYAFPHVALYGLVYLVYLYDAKGGDPTTTGMLALGIGFLVYAAVINAVGEYISNLDIFASQVVGARNAIASTFGALAFPGGCLLSGVRCSGICLSVCLWPQTLRRMRLPLVHHRRW